MIREEQLFNEVKQNASMIDSIRTRKLVKHLITQVYELNNEELNNDVRNELLHRMETHEITLEDHNNFLTMVDESSDLILDMIHYINGSMSELEQIDFCHKVTNRHSFKPDILNDKRTFILTYACVETDIIPFINLLKTSYDTLGLPETAFDLDKAQLYTLIETIMCYTKVSTYIYDLLNNKILEMKEDKKMMAEKINKLEMKLLELNEYYAILEVEQNDKMYSVEEEIDRVLEELEELYKVRD